MSGHRLDLVIEAGSKDKRYWRDMWEHRELFYMLVWRDIAVPVPANNRWYRVGNAEIR